VHLQPENQRLQAIMNQMSSEKIFLIHPDELFDSSETSFKSSIKF